MAFNKVQMHAGCKKGLAEGTVSVEHISNDSLQEICMNSVFLLSSRTWTGGKGGGSNREQEEADFFL